MWLRNGINYIAVVSSVLLSFKLFSQFTILSISQSIDVGSDCTGALLYITKPTRLGSLPSLQWLGLFLYCYSSCISWIFRISFSRRTVIYLVFFAAIILNSMAFFSLLNIRVLGLSAIVFVFYCVPTVFNREFLYKLLPFLLLSKVSYGHYFS